MKLMMIMGAGGCFIVALALGYVQENTLPTTLLRAVIAMLIGLFLARWWGLILQRQLSAAAIEKMNSSNDDQPQSEEADQSETPEAEGTA
tara:strand:- start:1868 stop:2137 length:270 start_codon:yes stop_codon:yes gene_type:complete